MLKSIKEKLRKLKTNLTSLDDQPIGKAALVVILFLDIFILISIFDGLADHTGQLTAPDDYIPQYCREVVIDSQWNATTRLRHVARITSEYHGSYYAPDERETKKEQHPICAPITGILRAIREDEGLSKNLRATLTLQQESAELRSELERIKGAYDTSLLETLARQRQGQADIKAIKSEMADKTQSLNEAVRRLKLLESSLGQDPRLRGLFALVEGISDADRNSLRDDLRGLHFWYPVKRLGMEMLFLLPLFFAFYLWNAKSIARHRPFQTLVSSHLFVVALVPVFFKVVELVYDVIPKKLLKHVIELLESLKLVALWHYLLMGVAILAALALIYLFQKKLFSREKLIERRISKGLCQNCNQHLPANSPVCPFCGFGQYRLCSHCGSSTHVYGRYCKECGQKGGELQNAESLS